MGDVVGAGGDLLGAAREFAAGKTFDYQGRDQPEAKQSQFFGFGIHAENLHAPDDNQERRSSAMQMLCGEPSGSRARGDQRDSPPCRNETRSPAQQMDAKLRKQETMRGDPSDGFD